MSKKPDGGPAYPAAEWDREAKQYRAFPAVSLRDYFAGQALAGMGAWAPVPNGQSWPPDAELHRIKAEYAYAQADAMLAARSK